MAKFVCSVCGYNHEGSVPPEKCPVCLASASEFSEIQEEVGVEDAKEEAIDESVDSGNSIVSKNDDVVNNEVTKSGEADDTNNNEEIDKLALARNNKKDILQIIKKETYPGAVRWYQNTFGCDLKDAVKAIDDIKMNYNVDHVGLYTNLDIEDIILMLDIIDKKIKSNDLGDIGLISWVMLKTGWTQDVAIKATAEADDEWEKRHPGKNKGCIITILIAISSTLSVFWLL